MIRHAALTAATLSLAVALPAAAQEAPPEHEVLFDALQLDRVVSIMRAEGLAQSEDLAGDLFPNRAASGWHASLERIYDEDAMRGRLLGGVSGALEGEDVDEMTAFFTSPQGERIVELELAAREAMMDDEADEAARAAWGILLEDDPERAGRIERFIEVNDLVEENVEGALNSNLAFMRGLGEGGAFLEPVPEDQLLADVWSAEPEIRAETTAWLGGFLSLAYEPLGDGDLDAYIAFSETEEGQALNRALFAGFDAMFEGLSGELGRAAAAQMVGQDI